MLRLLLLAAFVLVPMTRAESPVPQCYPCDLLQR
jgi:hypothetical protein